MDTGARAGAGLCLDDEGRVRFVPRLSRSNGIAPRPLPHWQWHIASRGGAGSGRFASSRPAGYNQVQKPSGETALHVWAPPADVGAGHQASAGSQGIAPMAHFLMPCPGGCRHRIRAGAREEGMEDTNTVYLTADAMKKLQDELEHLVNVRRPEIARQIAEAKADGDISENTGYDEAKTAQAFVEGRIRTVKGLLAAAVLISGNGHGDTVDLGVTVTIRERTSGDRETYTIVGSTEADPLSGRISLRSPIGHALMGHRIGDVVRVSAPDGAV
jgi:transcription elongation factor GreA